MNNLILDKIPGEPFFPKVNFNAQSGECEISGESYMENTYSFYLPVLEWLENYSTEVNKPVIFNFKLTYFNTSSSRSILEILQKLKEYKEKGGDVTVTWFYDEEDPDMKDEVEDFKVESEIEIKMIRF